MKQLTCEVCGGKLVMQSGGIAKCDSCGMEYTKERIQEKVQDGSTQCDVQDLKEFCFPEILLLNGDLPQEEAAVEQDRQGAHFYV